MPSLLTFFITSTTRTTFNLSKHYLKPHLQLINRRSIFNTSQNIPHIDAKDTRAKLSTGELKIIYRFPNIRLVQAFCRAKLYQTLIAVTGIPANGVLCYMNYVSSDLFISSFLVGGLATCMLFIISEVTRRSIGIIFMHKDLKSIRIAYLSFWGHRIDVDVPVDDIVPLADISENPDDIYCKVKRYSSDQYWYISIKMGKIFDKDAMESVFGTLGVGNVKKRN